MGFGILLFNLLVKFTKTMSNQPDILICENCERERPIYQKECICQEYQGMESPDLDDAGDNLCQKSHNNGEGAETCAECRAIKLNI